MADVRALRIGGFSRAIVWRPWWRVLAVGVALLLSLSSCLALGKVPLGPTALWHALCTPSSDTGLIVWQLRLPRILLGALVGGALALSGWLLQQVMRNPLASPDTLGVTSGASAAAVGYLSLLAADSGSAWLPLAAAAGALVAVGLVYRLAWHRGTTPLRLVLMGIGLSALLTAATTYLLVSSAFSTTLSAYVWLTGSVYGGNWSDVARLAVGVAVALVAMGALMRHALLAGVDDALAVGIGVRVQVMRGALTLLAAVLAGLAVAWGGAIAFVGLIAPHLAKRLVRIPGTAQVVMSIALGAIIVMLADLAGRTLFLPRDLPAGLFVAAIGAPFFLMLLIRQVR
ncbi:iron ABC transporter permease [Salinicola corii]|uniref:Iron ABC transporter permease n=1 Tax=Salinicola corii TaxID=2606937 RepID=A0A640WBV1_9GAMM|nr:iron ABC transporter permease [Salinicola corii]KAA0016969.1 iron ABC transporter permease [Salinicola corii]